MSWITYWGAKTILKRKQVKLIGTSPQFFHFEVKEYSVLIPTKEGENNGRKSTCTCVSGSLWKVEGECKHIRACKEWIKGEDLND